MSFDYVLKHADVEDLDVLTDYITDKGEGRISLDSDVCKRLVACKVAGRYELADRELIGAEVRAFGGNSLVNLFRGRGVDYKTLVHDVATHLKVNFSKSASAEDVEMLVLQKIFAESVAKMSPAEREQVFKELGIGEASGASPAAVAAAITAARMGGFATYKMAVIVANGIAKALLGRAIPFVYYSTLTKVINIAIGPVGWVITGLWTVADLASPAYRVTVPCVIQMAYMRRKAEAKAHTVFCPSCSAANDKGTKFCSSCGSAIATDAISSEALATRAKNLLTLAQSVEDGSISPRAEEGKAVPKRGKSESKNFVRKSSVKKTPSKKTPARKTKAKKVAVRKDSVKKAVAKRATVKKSTTKKAIGKTTAIKKPTTKVSKKPAAAGRKPASKKAVKR
ncbi:ubiquinol-cytochrome C chaperone family protein [Dyella nitratireducens]|uniref:Zinc-ribbon domain-containing protein n=1 Tax=Dyella nitratireducens TaxID=1849580 RepID=A0ABQ1FSU4_9GAMM|nr:ubiquinol-cytochrome C chaperone family protein [Dyella nitratireducens]GGA29148.1 hypothetical protein GCM10010981_17510 [Dyella nitratireducens]GLQ43184.1 hypothetical protein GCM10007902_30340 [Dyella nitratireducens]